MTIHRRGRGHSGPAPRSGLDGKFSVEYCAAAALLDGWVGIDTFTDARRFLPRTWRKCWIASGLNRKAPNRAPRWPPLCSKTGQRSAPNAPPFAGSAANPMSRDQRLEKVRDCFRRALSEADTERVLEMLENLERP